MNQTIKFPLLNYKIRYNWEYFFATLIWKIKWFILKISRFIHEQGNELCTWCNLIKQSTIELMDECFSNNINEDWIWVDKPWLRKYGSSCRIYKLIKISLNNNSVHWDLVNTFQMNYYPCSTGNRDKRMNIYRNTHRHRWLVLVEYFTIKTMILLESIYLISFKLLILY